MTDTFNQMYEAFGGHEYGRQHFYQWLSLYRSFGITCDYERITVPERPDTKHIPILCLAETDPDMVSKLFGRCLTWYQLVSFVGPVSRGKSGQSSDTWEHISFKDLTGPDTRSSAKGSYVLWVKDHVKVTKKGTLKYRPIEKEMTVTEALLYHLYQIQTHGRSYFDLHYNFGHRCLGSEGKNMLDWDMQDIKICLR